MAQVFFSKCYYCNVNKGVFGTFSWCVVCGIP